MAVHAYHEGLAGFDPRNVLHDGCEECEGRATGSIDGILALDSTNRLQLWRDMLAYEWSGTGIDRQPSRADCRLMHALYLVAVLMEGFGFKPDEIEERAAAELALLDDLFGRRP